MGDRYPLRPYEDPRPNSKVATTVDRWGGLCQDLFWAVCWPVVLLVTLAGIVTWAGCTVVSDWAALSALWSLKQDLHADRGTVEYDRLWAVTPGVLLTGSSAWGGQRAFRRVRAVAYRALPTRLDQARAAAVPGPGTSHDFGASPGSPAPATSAGATSAPGLSAPGLSAPGRSAPGRSAPGRSAPGSSAASPSATAGPADRHAPPPLAVAPPLVASGRRRPSPAPRPTR